MLIVQSINSHIVFNGQYLELQLLGNVVDHPNLP